MDKKLLKPEDIFRPGKHCWKIANASYASIIVDYANYYRDLHQSIVKAKKSIFILGWDIDGRIELLRGEEKEKSTAPACLFDLIKWKFEQQPDIKIYLNKWDYSIFFAKEREPLAGLHWKTIESDNFHYCIDSVLPLGACHHQKIAVIDDEVAYCGGMDIALARWDYREHHPVNPDRQDPKGLLNPHHTEPFTPYHDLMMVTAGEAARSLAELVRERWNLACETPAIPLLHEGSRDIPHSWPHSDPPDFENIHIAIARTLPPVRKNPRREEIIETYLTEIKQAEKFIYIENQFLVQEDIARALNKQLRDKPELRVLAISCDHPKGIMEKKSMWTPRLKFREIVESGGVADRVALAYPISREDGRQDPVRIHSKLMIIDDKFLHLGSANINNRSMGLDTECDQIIFGESDKACKKIAAVRTDLIREHSGREADEIDFLVESNAPIEEFLKEVPTSRQHFRRIDDEEYRHERFVKIAKVFSDPRRPLISADITIPISRKHVQRHISKPWPWLALCLVVLISILIPYIPDMESLTRWIENLLDSKLAIPGIILLFILSGIVLFPVTILITITAAIFGSSMGLALSIVGTLLSASIGYYIGRKISITKSQTMFGIKFKQFKEKIRDSGVAGVSIIRMLPVAPFGLMNILFGMNGVAFSSYIAGTLFGILPGTVALSLFGSSLFRLFKEPNTQDTILLVVGLFLWLGIVACSHILDKKFRQRFSS